MRLKLLLLALSFTLSQALEPFSTGALVGAAFGGGAAILGAYRYRMKIFYLFSYRLLTLMTHQIQTGLQI